MRFFFLSIWPTVETRRTHILFDKSKILITSAEDECDRSLTTATEFSDVPYPAHTTYIIYIAGGEYKHYIIRTRSRSYGRAQISHGAITPRYIYLVTAGSAHAHTLVYVHRRRRIYCRGGKFSMGCCNGGGGSVY